MILCADDFGLNDKVSQGILDLVKRKKLNSVSCLVTTDCWKNKAKCLKPFLGTIETGLHLSLTVPKAFNCPEQSLGTLIRKSYLGQLNQTQITNEFFKQMESFKKYTGQMPDYVDGHQFCHLFPIIREALMELSREFLFKKKKIYVRVFRQPPKNIPTSVFLPVWILSQVASLSSKKLIKLLEGKGISFNSRLFGYHPYSIPPMEYFTYYLKEKPGEKDIFFCHPGLSSEDTSDRFHHYRFEIYNFMMSSQFDKLLHDYGVSLKINRI